jgi:ArsR family metal-binding transcriptional regulator
LKYAYTVYIALLLVLALSALPVVQGSDFDSEVGVLVEEAGRLYSKGVDVAVVIEKLDNAIALYESGRVDEAYAALSEARSMIMDLSSIADQVYYYNTMVKAVTVAVLAVIPIAIYILLPRIYLYVWFKTRRKWIVRG